MMADSGPNPTLGENSDARNDDKSKGNSEEQVVVQGDDKSKGNAEEQVVVQKDVCAICLLPVLDPTDEAQRVEHVENCAEEFDDSRECGICGANLYNRNNVESVLLGNCQHSFCLICIKTWRTNADERTVRRFRKCRYCKSFSEFITRRSSWSDSFGRAKRLRRK